MVWWLLLQIQKNVYLESQQGLMATGYTYPEWYDDIQGQNYAGKLYNFCAFDMVCKLEMRYLFGAGLLVPRASYHSIF
jgi:hypothetical protein